jgi:hypothetical protein
MLTDDNSHSPDDYIEWDNYQSYLLSSEFPNGIVEIKEIYLTTLHVFLFI